MTGMFVNIALFVIEITIAETMFTLKLKKRSNFKLRLAAYFLGSASTMLIGLLPSSAFDNAIISSLIFLVIFGITLALLWFCYDESFINILFCGIGAYTAQHFAYELANLIITLIMWGKSPFLDLYSSTVIDFTKFDIHALFWLLIYALSYWLVYGICFFALARKIGREKSLSVENVSLLFLAAIGLLADIVLNSVYVYFDTTRNIVTSVIIYVYNCLCCVLIIAVQLHLIKNKKLENDLNFIKKLNEQQQKNYKISKQSIEIINMKCHDMRYQIRKIGERETISASAVSEIENAVSVYDSAVVTGNAVLDTVLTEKSLRCYGSGVQLICVADGKLLSFMADEDVYSLLGNALDNAIEAATNCPEEKRLIDLNLSSVGKMVSLIIYNTYAVEVKTKNGEIITSKKDKTAHGYGLKSISYIVGKYGGDMDVSAKDGIFTLSVMFPRTEKTNVT